MFPNNNKSTQNQKKEKTIISRIDRNLEEKKIFTLSSYSAKSREIVWKETLSTGEEIERKIIIGKMPDTGIEVGVLDTHHYLMYQILKYFLFEKLSKEKFFEKIKREGRISFKDLSKEEREIIKTPIHFSINRILKLLKQPAGGWQYERVLKWLEGLRVRPIVFVNSFYSKLGEEIKEWLIMTILDHLRLYEKKDRKRKKIRGYGYFKFDDNLLENDLNFYTHPVRFDVIATLKDEKSEEKKRHRFQEKAIFLYIYLDRMLYDKNHFHKNLKDLFEEMDWSDKFVRTPVDRKIKLQPIIDQLKGKELSSGIISYIDILKTEDGQDYKLVAKKKPFSKPLKTEDFLKLSLPKKTTPPPDSQETSQATELVQYFHKFLQRPNHQPTKKEIKQAKNLLTELEENLEKAKFIVNHALREAETTHFKMQFFGAILQYKEEALKRWEIKEKIREREEAIKKCSLCDEAGMLPIFDKETKRYLVDYCPHDKEIIKSKGYEYDNKVRAWVKIELTN